MKRIASVLLGSLMLLSACSDSEHSKPMSREVSSLPEPESLAVDEAYPERLINIAYAQLSKSVEAAQALQSSAEALRKNATPERLAEARNHWRASYSAYLSSLAASDIPVREPSEWFAAKLTRRHLAEQINSWPVEPGYIDYLEGYPFTGIVNDTTLVIDRESLLAQHQFSDVTYVSVGYHAIEFVLWGENGQRPASDFDMNAAKPEEGDSSPVAHHERRGDYLTTLVGILIADLQRLQMRWTPSPEAQGYYAQLLSAATPTETLQASLLTVNRIIEQDLLQNYLTDTGSSPFSGGTPVDVEAIMRGIRQVLISEDGASGLQPLLTARKQEKDLTLLAEVITLTSADTACIAGWQTAVSYLEGQSACRQQMLDLLITLKQINDQLGLQIPASG